MPSYSIASGSYDGHVRVYDVRMGKTTVDVLAHPVTSVRCSADGNALLASTLDSYIRMLDQVDGKLLAAFGGPGKRGDRASQSSPRTKPRHSYQNTELRVRSVFAQGDAVVLSGSEAAKDGAAAPGAAVFAWDVLSGEVMAAVPMGGEVKVVSCVAWNEKGFWGGGCSDGMWLAFEKKSVFEYNAKLVSRHRPSLRLSQRVIAAAKRGSRSKPQQAFLNETKRPNLHPTVFC